MSFQCIKINEPIFVSKQGVQLFQYRRCSGKSERKAMYPLFYKHKSLDFGKKIENKLRTCKAKLAVPQNKVSRLVIHNIRTNHENRAWPHLYWTACRLVLLSQGYLRYKTTSSWNVSSETQVKIFLFQDTKVFISLTIP